MLRRRLVPTMIVIAVIAVIAALLSGVVPVMEGVFRLLLPQFAGTRLVPLEPPVELPASPSVPPPTVGPPGEPALGGAVGMPTATGSPPAMPDRPPAPAGGRPTPEVHTPWPSSGVITYVVVSGDTVSQLAARFGSSVTAIAEASGLVDPGKIAVGQVLTIPVLSRAPEGP